MISDASGEIWFAGPCVEQKLGKKGLENIGFGVKDTDEYGGQVPSWATYKPFADRRETITFEAYKALVICHVGQDKSAAPHSQGGDG